MVRARVLETAAFALIVLLSALAPSDAQAPPPPMPPQASTAPPPAPGFVPPYEIMRTVRKAGFSPLAPPLREGTTYVLRADDYRGILMRVVVDARTGAIRDANRIVPGPGSGPYGEVGMMGPDEPAPDDTLPPYGTPPEFDASEMAPPDQGAMPPPPARLAAPRGAPRATVMVLPPLPRPRPAELASRKSVGDMKPDAPPAAADAKPAANSATTPEANNAAAKPEATSAAPAAPAASPPAKPSQAPAALSINN